jgi:hypothetical protein
MIKRPHEESFPVPAMAKTPCQESPDRLLECLVGNFTHEIQPAKVPPLFRHQPDEDKIQYTEAA